jgi:DNA-binding transcriptional ArsR family regulator
MRETHHPPREELDVSCVLHALSDPARLAIVRHLAGDGECHCGHFSLEISKATLSHHLRVLREAGVVFRRPDGRKRYFSLRAADLEARFPGLIEAVLGSQVARAQGQRELRVPAADPQPISAAGA